MLIVGGCSGGAKTVGPNDIVGLRTVSGLSRNHVTQPTSYLPAPPIGGGHSRVPQTCGAYDKAVPDEAAVHSMEHGAVWITYRPDLSRADIDRLRVLAEQTFVLISPYPKLPAPVVASAWGRQLRLPSVDDSRLTRFVDEFRLGPQTPERGPACAGPATPQSGGRPPVTATV